MALDPHSVQFILDDLREQLAAAGIDAPEVDAELLVGHVLGVSRGRVQALAIMGKELSRAEAARAKELGDLRAERIPLQHLTGRAPFRSIELQVGPGVFVPRPETELLAQIAIDELTEAADPIALDLCTGSGAVALAIANEVPAARVWAVEKSVEAYAWAARNVEALGDGRVNLLLGDVAELDRAVLRADDEHKRRNDRGYGADSAPDGHDRQGQGQGQDQDRGRDRDDGDRDGLDRDGDDRDNQYGDEGALGDYGDDHTHDGDYADYQAAHADRDDYNAHDGYNAHDDYNTHDNTSYDAFEEHAGAVAAAIAPIAGRVTVLASNPPYVPSGAIPLDPEVRDHDPDLALYSGEDGLDVIRILSRAGLRLVVPGGLIALEHAEEQGASIRRLLERDGWQAAQTHVDLTGRDRVTTARATA